jgi:hypothetical protein
MPEEIINEHEMEIENYYHVLESNYENKQQMEDTFLELDISSFNKDLTIIRIDSSSKLQTVEINEQVNQLKNDISSLLTEKKIDIISAPSEIPFEYIVDINCIYNKISHTFTKIDITVLKKSKYHGHFSIDLSNGLNEEEVKIPMGDLSQICSETIYLLIKK